MNRSPGPGGGLDCSAVLFGAFRSGRARIIGDVFLTVKKGHFDSHLIQRVTGREVPGLHWQLGHIVEEHFYTPIVDYVRDTG